MEEELELKLSEIRTNIRRIEKERNKIFEPMYIELRDLKSAVKKTIKKIGKGLTEEGKEILEKARKEFDDYDNIGRRNIQTHYERNGNEEDKYTEMVKGGIIESQLQLKFLRDKVMQEYSYEKEYEEEYEDPDILHKIQMITSDISRITKETQDKIHEFTTLEKELLKDYSKKLLVLLEN